MISGSYSPLRFSLVTSTCCLLAAALSVGALAQDNDSRSQDVEAASLGLRAPVSAPGSVVIEAEPLAEPTIDELMQTFRAALERDRRPMGIVERQLAGGIIEVNTRYGRFCLAPLPTYLSSSLTTSSGLTTFCSPY
jgi:hypothetical protein